MPDLAKLYLVVAQAEGTVQLPIPFHLLESAKCEADRVAGFMDRAEDDVRVFELDLRTLKVKDAYVPEMVSSDEPEEDEQHVPPLPRLRSWQGRAVLRVQRPPWRPQRLGLPARGRAADRVVSRLQEEHLLRPRPRAPEGKGRGEGIPTVSWLNFVSGAAGGILGIWLSQRVFRWWNRRGWIVRIELDVVVDFQASPRRMEQHSFYLEKKGGLHSRARQARRFRTMEAAKAGAAEWNLVLFEDEFRHMAVMEVAVERTGVVLDREEKALRAGMGIRSKGQI